MTAFFESVGVQVVGTTPVTRSYEVAEEALADTTEMINSFSTKLGVKLPQRFAESQEKRLELAAARAAQPDRFHMGVLVPLADGRWYQIDPHMQSAGILEHSDHLDSEVSVLRLASGAHPGVALLHDEQLQNHRQTERAREKFLEVIQIAALLYDEWRRFGCNPRAAIPLLARSAALEVLIETGILHDEEKTSLYLRHLRGEEQGYLMATVQGKPLMFRTESGQMASPADHSKLVIMHQVLTFAGMCGMAEQNALEEVDMANPYAYFAEGFEYCLGVLCVAAYRKVVEELRYSIEHVSLPHPLMEIYEPSFRVGVELVAHLNALGEQDNDVIMSLAAVCGGQHHLILAATESLRTEAPASTLANEALATLKATPAILSNANDVLRQLLGEQPEEELEYGTTSL